VSFVPYFKMKDLIEDKINCIQPRHFMTKKFVQRMQGKNVKVLSWPIYKESQLKKFFQKKVDMVMTGDDDILKLIKKYRRNGSKIMDGILEPYWKRNLKWLLAGAGCLGVFIYFL